MLEIVFSMANLVTTSLHYLLYGSYKTGYLLVNCVNTTFQYFLAFAENLFIFVTLLCESVAIFLQDNVHFLQQVLVFAVSSFGAVCTSIATIYYKISTLLCAIAHLIVLTYVALTSGIAAIITGIAKIIVFLKKMIILFGSGVWFLITLLPLLLYYFCVFFVSLMNRLYQEICELCCIGVLKAKTVVKTTVFFILDVPIESLVGIIIAFSLAYVVGQFYILIKIYFKQKLRKIKNWYRQQHVNVGNMFPRTPQQQVNRNLAVRGRPQVRPIQQTSIPLTIPTKAKDNTDQNDERFCVICQERNKCVLLLPCRHLCLCAECTRELRYYNESCPICRTNIDSTMKIYV